MARKETITIQNILDTAFAMTREEGFEKVSARKIAARAGCSTQPIFRVYKNMDELWDAVYNKAADFFQDYYSLYPRTGKVPFSSLGMAYIEFAREENHLFKLLFLPHRENKRSIFELLNGEKENVMYEIRLATDMGCEKPDELFRKMWLFIHGTACLNLTGDFDLSEEETLNLIQDSFEAFSGRHLRN